RTVIGGIGGTFVIGVGALLLGVALMAVYYSSRRRRDCADQAIADVRAAASADPGTVG
ncbi:MAG: family permease, partial [Micrococcaceae bacterium]|nr:family permease [Micrococcaceae bacterium]